MADQLPEFGAMFLRERQAKMAQQSERLQQEAQQSQMQAILENRIASKRRTSPEVVSAVNQYIDPKYTGDRSALAAIIGDVSLLDAANTALRGNREYSSKMEQQLMENQPITAQDQALFESVRTGQTFQGARPTLTGNKAKMYGTALQGQREMTPQKQTQTIPMLQAQARLDQLGVNITLDHDPTVQEFNALTAHTQAPTKELTHQAELKAKYGFTGQRDVDTYFYRGFRSAALQARKPEGNKQLSQADLIDAEGEASAASYRAAEAVWNQGMLPETAQQIFMPGGDPATQEATLANWQNEQQQGGSAAPAAPPAQTAVAPGTVLPNKKPAPPAAPTVEMMLHQLNLDDTPTHRAIVETFLKRKKG